jgi:hypothetical protein
MHNHLHKVLEPMAILMLPDTITTIIRVVHYGGELKAQRLKGIGSSLCSQKPGHMHRLAA